MSGLEGFALHLAQTPQGRPIEISECRGLDAIGEHAREEPSRKMGGSDPGQMVSPLEAKLVGVEAGRLATAASSLSRSDDNGAGLTEASPAPLALWRFAISRRLTGPWACAPLRPIRPRFAGRLRRGVQRGAIAPHLRRFDPIDRSSRLVGPIDPDGVAALA